MKYDIGQKIKHSGVAWIIVERCQRSDVLQEFGCDTFRVAPRPTEYVAALERNHQVTVRIQEWEVAPWQD